MRFYSDIVLEKQTRQSKWFGIILLGLMAFILGATVLITTSMAEAEEKPSHHAFLAQDEATATPEEASDNLPESQPLPTIEPFLQTDLQIISGNVQRPNGIFWHDDFLYTSCAGDFTIYKIHDTTGETTTYIAGVQNVHTLYVSPINNVINIWAADFQRNAVVSINTSQSPARVDIASELASPWGLSALDDETFLVTQLRSDDVVRVSRDGSSVDAVARGFRNPTGIAIDGNFVYVGNNGSARRAIEWFEYDANTIVEEEDLLPLVSGLQNTTNVIMGPDNLLYFAYSLGTRGIVGRVDPELCREQEGCTNVDVEIVLWSELAAPLAGLTISPDMRLFVHTMFGSEIYWVQLPTDTLEAATGVE